MDPNQKFDLKKKVQGRYTNYISSFILLLSGIVALVFASKYPRVSLLCYILSIFALIMIFESQFELFMVGKITRLIKGTRNPKKQYVEGRYLDHRVEFFIGKPASINYSVITLQNPLLADSDAIRNFIGSKLRQKGLNNYDILMTGNSIILSKTLIVAIQLNLSRAGSAYSLLQEACSEFRLS